MNLRKLLSLAYDLGRRLLVAFETPTGIPFGTVNLKYGVPVGEIDVTCVAGGGTFCLEFGVLSELTGDRSFERAALRATTSLMALRSARGLLGNHVNISDGSWPYRDSGIGHGVDSFYEYLAKASVLFRSSRYERLFRAARWPIERFLYRDGFYLEVELSTLQVTWQVFNTLQAFWPGVLAERGEIELAKHVLRRFMSVWHSHDASPEKVYRLSKFYLVFI